MQPHSPLHRRVGRPGPGQTVTSLTTSEKEASTGFRDRKARAGLLQPPDAVLAEDPQVRLWESQFSQLQMGVISICGSVSSEMAASKATPSVACRGVRITMARTR